MYNLLLDNSTSSDWVMLVLTGLLIVVGAAIAVCTVIALIYRITIASKYLKYNKEQNDAGMTASEIAQYFLKSVGISDVKVKRAGLFRAMIFGNSYSYYTKTIYLRGLIYNQKSVTAAAMACQKVGHAVQHKNQDKKFLYVAKLRPWMLFAPFAFLPLALLGVLLDVFVFKSIGIMTIILSSLGLIYFLASFFSVLFTIGVERKSNEQALALLKEHKILSDNDIQKVETLFDTFIKAYVVDFVINILYIVWYILKILIKILGKKKK